MAQALFNIDKSSPRPKYKQIIDGIISAIEHQKLRKGDALPTVSHLCERFSIARQTVLDSYSALKDRGIIEAVPRRGYYVASESVEHSKRVLFLIDEFTAYKQVMYYAFKSCCGSDVVIDVYFHHCNLDLLSDLVSDNLGKYSNYAVSLFDNIKILDILKTIPTNKLLVLDRQDPPLPENYNYVCQDFDEAVFKGLESGLDLIRKYNCFTYITCDKEAEPRRFSLPPKEIEYAVERFCRKYSIPCEIMYDLNGREINRHEAYMIMFDDDLVEVIQRSKAQGLQIGQDVGIISFNETPMNKVVCDGLTVLSTDFAQLGIAAAEHILGDDKRTTRIYVPSSLIVRNSL